MKKKICGALNSSKNIFLKVVKLINKNKKKIVIGLSVFLIVFISVFSFINLRYPTKINAYIAHVINKGEPANSYFDDENFYNAVIDAYNKENKTSLPYTTNLTDEQFKSIKSVSYSGSNKSDSEKIKSTTGIEKLTFLTHLDLGYNKISSIDLSKNTALTGLDLYSNNLNNIDLSKNTALEGLRLGSNNIRNIDLSKNTSLTSLELDSNNIRNIGLSQNTSLTSLDLDSNNIRNIDLNKNTSLTSLDLRWNNISNIDLSKNTALTRLDLGYNKISNIDLSKNTALTSLDLRCNNISNIDLSKNTALTYLDLGYNKISSIDLSNNTNLTSLDLYSNNLNNIDLSKNTSLKYLNLKSNNLSSIKLYDNYDISKLKDAIKNQNTYQTNLDLGSNRIINSTYKYYCSSKIVISSEADIQTFIDNLGLKNLTAKVFNNDEEISSGKVKYDYILKLYYEDVEIDSVPVKILGNSAFDDEVFYKAVIDDYNKENNTSLPYTINLTDEQLSSIKNISYSGYYKSYSEKIKSTTGIEKLTSLTDLDLHGNNISNIDLSKNTSLTSLDLRWNNISNIDLSKNTALIELDLDNNNISNIDLSKNTALIELGLYENNISNIDLSKNTALTGLDLSNNNISSIDLSKNTALTGLDLHGNNISNIDLSKNTSLTSLNLDWNNISNIDLSKNTALTRLELSNNNISSIDLSKNTALTRLDLSNNNISKIDLSKNTALTSLNLDWNNISKIDLSKNTALTFLNLDWNNISKIDLSKNTTLTSLELRNNKISSIDLSKNTKLTTLYLDYNPLKLNAYVKENGTLTSSNIKLPEGSDKFYLTYEIEDNSIANFADNKLNGLKVGKTSATVTLNGVKASSSSTENMKIDGTITVFGMTSSKYKINDAEKYIYTKNDTDSNTILSNINFDNVNGRIDNNKLILYDGNTIVDEYKIINLSSNTYDLSKDYIYDNNFNKDNINVVNGSLEEKDNTLNIKYNDEVLDSKKIVRVTSEKYDLTKDYIYDNNFNKDNINVVNGSLEEKDNTLNIKYNDEVLDSKKIVKIASDKYDLTKNYIYNVNNSFDVSDIKCTNCKAVYENNKLIIKYNDEIVEEIDVVSINFESSEYDLSKDYIYIGTGSFDESKIKSENITYEIENNILKLKYKDELLKSYKLVSVSSNVYQIKDKYLYVFDSMFDKSNIKVTNGTFDVTNNKVTIKYSEDKLDEFDIVGISSSVYDLRNGYILLKTNEKLDLSLINTANVTLDLNDDTLNVLFNSEVIRTYKIVRYESSKYDLTKDYIYLGIKEFNKDDMVLENCIVEEKDNVLNIKYGDEIVRSYKLVRVSSNNYKVGNGYVYTKNEEFNSNLLDVTNASIEEQEGSINIMYGKDKLDEFKLLKVTSNTYDLTKDYIYDNNFNKDNIKVTNVSLEEKDNTLNIKYNAEVLDSKKIVKVKSNTYDLTKDYIYIGNKKLDESKFNLINCTLQVDNNTLNVIYDNNVLKSYKLVKISSNTYDLNKNYIYVGNGIFDKNLLSVINGIVNVLNDKIEIKYNSDVLKEFKLLKYSSNKYDLTKEYIYLGINNFDKNNISLVNLSLNIDDNYNLNIKYGDDVMKTYKLVSVSSSKYDLSKDNIKVTKSDGLDFKDIKVTNGTKEYLDNKLYIKYNDDILKVYTISTRAKGDITGDDKITIADVSLLYRHVRKTKVIEDSKTLEVSDLTGDDKITIADVAKLYRYVRGKITEL